MERDVAAFSGIPVLVTSVGYSLPMYFRHIPIVEQNLHLTRALLGLWIFHRLLGGGGRLNAPPMISTPGRRREKRKAAFESSRKIISKSFRSFFVSGQN